MGGDSILNGVVDVVGVADVVDGVNVVDVVGVVDANVVVDTLDDVEDTSKSRLLSNKSCLTRTGFLKIVFF